MVKYILILGVIFLAILSTNEVLAEYEYDVFHGLQVPGVDESFEIKYAVQRNLFDASVEILRKSITFTFAGNITNDTFIVVLPDQLIEGPFNVWLDKTQITNFEVEKKGSQSILQIPLFDTTEQTIIVGSKIAGQYTPKPGPVINKITAYIEDRIYLAGDHIIVNGQVEDLVGLQHVTLAVIGPKGNNLVLDTLRIDENSMFDTVISTSGIKWANPGEYIIKITATDADSFTISFKYANYKIPQWVKTNAGWWAQNLIDDVTFTNSIQHLIKEQIIWIPDAQSPEKPKSAEIPGWIRTSAEWWYQGRITDSDFVDGIQFLIRNGIITIP